MAWTEEIQRVQKEAEEADSILASLPSSQAPEIVKLRKLLYPRYELQKAAYALKVSEELLAVIPRLPQDKRRQFGQWGNTWKRLAEDELEEERRFGEQSL